MELDWDLQAVVRGCAATTTTTTTTTTSSASTCTLNIDSLSSFQPREEEDQFLFLSDPFEVSKTRNTDDLNDLFFKPFSPKFESLSPQTIPISPLSVLGGLQDLSPQQHQQQQTQKHPKQFFGISRSASTTHTPSSRSKRRKSQLKRVCQVPAEGLSSDLWSWRKYGQKPIKGSPYPRGYYRCSTSKGCLARKQVERNRSDPGMFIVTYTAEHNHPIPTHRNSLAGSTRQKPAAAQDDAAGKPTCSSPFSPENLSPVMEKILESEEDELDVSDMVISDDFFEGLDDLTGPTAGDCFSVYSPASSQFPWMSNNVTTTAAGGR